MNELSLKKAKTTVLTKVIAFITLVLSFFCIGSATVQAEEILPSIDEAQLVINMPNKFDKSNWNETAVVVGDSFAGKYYRVKKLTSTDTIEIMKFQIMEDGTLKTCSLNAELMYSLMFFTDEVMAIDYVEVVKDNETYIEFYLPEDFYLKAIFQGAIKEFKFNDTHTITEISPNIELSIITPPINIGDTTEDGVLIVDKNYQIFSMPNKFDKSNWNETAVVVGDSFAGKYFRVKKPTSKTQRNLMNFQIMNNGESSYTTLIFDLNTQMITTINGLTVEYLEVVKDNEIYIEFYMPEEFNFKACFASDLDTVVELYFDNTYTISYLSAENELMTITPPTNNDAGEENQTPDKLPDVDLDANIDVNNPSFIVQVGAITADLFKIKDVSLVAIGWVTVVSLVCLAIIAVGLLFKR